jgi:hypothetical protein
MLTHGLKSFQFTSGAQSCNRSLATDLEPRRSKQMFHFESKSKDTARAQNLPFQIDKMSIGRKNFVIAHIGAIALTIALAVGLCASVSLAIRLFFEGR